jgi:hypothetical protein
LTIGDASADLDADAASHVRAQRGVAKREDDLALEIEEL